VHIRKHSITIPPNKIDNFDKTKALNSEKLNMHCVIAFDELSFLVHNFCQPL